MTQAIPVELLQCIGAKAFAQVMVSGRAALGPIAQEVIALASSVVAKEPPQKAFVAHGSGVTPSFHEHAVNMLAKGLAAQGQAGVHNAIRQIYAMVFVAAGLPTQGIVSHTGRPQAVAPPAVPESQDDQIARRAIACIAEHLGMPTDAIALSSRLVADIGADSLDLVELTMAIEDEMNIEITDEEAERVSTVQDVVALVTRLRIEQKVLGVDALLLQA